MFDGRANLHKEVLELEVSERILALKIHKKELTLSRLSQLVDDADHCRVSRLSVVVAVVVVVILVPVGSCIVVVIVVVNSNRCLVD